MSGRISVTLKYTLHAFVLIKIFSLGPVVDDNGVDKVVVMCSLMLMMCETCV